MITLEQIAELGVAARRANLVDLLLAGEKMKPSIPPSVDNASRETKWRDQCAEADVTVEQYQHQSIRARAHARDSSTAASISSKGTFALCSWTALCAESKMCLLTASV